MTEQSEVTGPLLRALDRIPHVAAMRVHSGQVRVSGGYMHLAPEGTPDVYATVRGVPLYLECKTPTGRLRTEQLVRHEHLRRAGARVEVVRSVSEGIAIVREILEAKHAS